MGSAPTKLVNERISLSVPFGDEIPWGLVITRANVTVTVFSGTDPYPQRVFWRATSLDNCSVVLQFRQGVSGVIYNVLVEAIAGEIPYSKSFCLAILPDSAELPDLFPLTRILTSHPYVQTFNDSGDISFEVTGGTLTLVVKHGVVASDLTTLSLSVAPSALILYIPPKFIDLTTYSLTIVGGTLALPPHGQFKDNTTFSLTVKDGTILIPPLGQFKDNTTLSLTVTPSTLLWPLAEHLLMTEDGKVIMTEDGKVIMTG